MTLQEKIGQFFSPAAFIHDTEENIQAMEKLIREQHIGGITFFHSRYSAAANFEKRAEKGWGKSGKGTKKKAGKRHYFGNFWPYMIQYQGKSHPKKTQVNFWLCQKASMGKENGFMGARI